MKSNPVYLDDLNYNSKDYRVKVKVIEKTRPAVSPNKKKTTYQNVILQDDKVLPLGLITRLIQCVVLHFVSL
jgi:hypothetical protein